MNLQENINRIHQMMGVINEDDKSAKISRLLLKVPISGTDGKDLLFNKYISPPED